MMCSLPPRLTLECWVCARSPAVGMGLCLALHSWSPSDQRVSGFTARPYNPHNSYWSMFLNQWRQAFLSHTGRHATGKLVLVHVSRRELLIRTGELLFRELRSVSSRGLGVQAAILVPSAADTFSFS